MLMEEVEVTFSHLLELAVGNPEAGAVNFNFLHEFLLGVLQHLGISNNLARISQEIDNRKVDPSSSVEKNTNVEKSASVADASAPVAASASGNIQPAPAADTIPNAAGVTGDSAIETKQSAENVSSERKASVVPPMEGPVTGRRRSTVGPKRVSVSSGHRGSLAPLTGESGESMTKAGDMWHVLNINRRVETAEAAIEGLTSLFDRMNLQLDELRHGNDEDNELIAAPVPTNAPNADFTAMLASTKDQISAQLADVRKDMNTKLESCSTKEDLKGFCNESKVTDLINKNMLSLAQSPPVDTSAAGGDDSTGVPSDAFNSLQNELRISTKCLTDRIDAIDNALESKITPKHEEFNDNISKLRLEVKENKEKISSFNTSTKVPSTSNPNAESGNTSDIAPLIAPIKNDLDSLKEKVASLSNDLSTLNGVVNGMKEDITHAQNGVSELSSKTESVETSQRGMSATLTKVSRDVEENVENIQKLQQGGVVPEKVATDQDTEGTLTKMRGSIYDIQEKQVSLQSQIDATASDGRRNEKQVKEALKKLQELDESKVDKDQFNAMFDTKADKKDLNAVLNQEQFDECVSGLDRHIQNLKQDIFSNEAKQRKNLQNLQDVVDAKLDREEATQIRNYIDSRFKSFKPKMPAIQPAEDCAAGSRKRVMPDCNCISCDRPVDIPMDDRCPTLPYFHALPGMKTIRPVTTFELQTIRQHMHHNWSQGNTKDKYALAEAREKLQRELLQLCGVSDLDELSGGVLNETSNRPCGGVHTLANHRKSLNKPPMFYREDLSAFAPAERQETNVVGKDGHVYKGRLQQHQGTPELPDILSGSINGDARQESRRSGGKSASSLHEKTDIVTVLPTIES